MTKNVQFGQIGLSGLSVPKPAAEEREVKLENVFFLKVLVSVLPSAISVYIFYEISYHCIALECLC